MTGTLINVVAVIIGGALGCFLGSKFPERIQKTVMAGLGIFTILLGTVNFLDSNNILLVLGALLGGVLLGEWLRIEEALEAVGGWLQRTLIKQKNNTSAERFIEGFVAASLLFCIGPMAIMGSIQDGLTGDFTTLFIKSIMDAFAAIAFASTMGIGVIFSALMVLIYQGGISLLAGVAQSAITSAMMSELNAIGGVLLVGIGISSLLGIKKIRMGSFLPALILAPLLVWVIEALQ